ncbi:low molecular weight protein-tyrosine-phosphatase [Treponema sp. C6A8]|uniref:low molecular weight protein-tyrosine-phosphatase n=1 Tax=Treponema sp. C6A8 TaxID=1410609 RepID=UPI0004845068|nr:low molecular weight protein-tyrosine-phosphatase [Treponema sp. C6A8]
MTRILFVCHGNICRSPMAEFVMKHLVHKAGRDSEFQIDSAATSTEEIGNGMHRGTVEKLREQGVPFTNHRARQITAADYEKYDYLIGMDEENIFNMYRRWQGDPLGKVHLLLEYCGCTDEVADPWYTGNFDATWADVYAGCAAMLDQL